MSYIFITYFLIELLILFLYRWKLVCVIFDTIFHERIWFRRERLDDFDCISDVKYVTKVDDLYFFISPSKFGYIEYYDCTSKYHDIILFGPEIAITTGVRDKTIKREYLISLSNLVKWLFVKYLDSKKLDSFVINATRDYLFEYKPSIITRYFRKQKLKKLSE